MAIFDFKCPWCNRIEQDVLVRAGYARALDCLDCGTGMYRLLGRPAPAIFERGGTGASRASA